jgi:polysaccharide deacetylase 2 family uncharacterized protein YibQ
VRFRFNKKEWENFKKSKNARFHVDWKGFREKIEKIKFHVPWKGLRWSFKLRPNINWKLRPNINWKSLRENRKLKFNIGLAVVLIVLFVVFPDIIYFFYRSSHNIEKAPILLQVQPVKPAVKQAGAKKPAGKIVQAPTLRSGQVRTGEAEKKEKAVKPKVRLSNRSVARVAIVLDDAGGKAPDYNSILSIKEPLTISVLPDMPDSAGIAKSMIDGGFEVMLHLPMEALSPNFRRSGGGMVACADSDDVIKKTVLNDLASVKWAVGVNNHMGSKATADERVMTAVFNALKGRGLFFIDSRTSDRSIAYKLAKNFHIPSAENNIFLDSQTGQTYIEASMRRLVSMARQNGSAIGIGHVTRPMTISVLKRLMPEYKKDGVDFVYASELVK